MMRQEHESKLTPPTDDMLLAWSIGRRKIMFFFAFSATCALPKEAGTCSNFSVKWFYDAAYGDCGRFWYGGCDGNDNQFDTKEACRSLCIAASGLGKPYLF